MRIHHFLSPVFRNNSVPRLLYISRQEHGISRPLHRHENICEVTLVLHGKGSFRLEENLYAVQEGDILINNAWEEHELLSEKNSLEAYCLGFTEVFFRDYPDNFLTPPKTYSVRRSGRKFLFLKDLAEQILDLDPQNTAESALLQSLALSFILTAVSVPIENASPVVTGNASDITARIKEYISFHFTDTITLDDIANELAFSTDYLSHTFKKATGYSIKEYVIRIRIGYAETLLISSDYSVSHIATLTGFDNPNHFQTTFKKVAGIPPLQYRKKYLKLLHGERNQ